MSPMVFGQTLHIGILKYVLTVILYSEFDSILKDD